MDSTSSWYEIGHNTLYIPKIGSHSSTSDTKETLMGPADLSNATRLAGCSWCSSCSLRLCLRFVPAIIHNIDNLI